MQAQERIIIALDVASEAAAWDILEKLHGQVRFVKVGMELYYAAGGRLVERLKERGLRVFLDLKLHDIPQTVAKAAQVLTRLGADMVNFHAAGGLAMMQAAREGVEKALSPGQRRPLLLAVTQLTSTDQRRLNEEIGIPGSVEECVLRYARLAKEAGLDGVVASALEVPALKKALGLGVAHRDAGGPAQGKRPRGSGAGGPPGEALRLGSDYLVIGRPITQAPDPASAFALVVQELVQSAGEEGSAESLR